MVGALKSIALPNLAVLSILPCSCVSKVNKRIIVGAAIWFLRFAAAIREKPNLRGQNVPGGANDQFPPADIQTGRASIAPHPNRQFGFHYS